MEFKVGDTVRCEEREFTGRVVYVIPDPEDWEPYVVEVQEGDYLGWPGNDNGIPGLSPDKRYSYCAFESLELIDTSPYPRIKTTFLEGVEP